MPQEFHVLRCYSCEKFQVHQTKKAKKWQCKVCGEKQSLKEAYFIGSAKDCRIKVQTLNFEDGQRKQVLMLQQNNDSFEEDTLFDSAAENDAYEFENIPSETIQTSWNNPPAFIADQSSSHMPMKKRKYTEDPLSEIYNEDVLYSDFEQHKKGEMMQCTNVTLETPSQETSISFDVSFGSNSANSITSTFESISAPLKLNIENDKKTNAEPSVKKCRDSKNRGFQLIMNAAKKLNADTELF